MTEQRNTRQHFDIANYYSQLLFGRIWDLLLGALSGRFVPPILVHIDPHFGRF